MKSFFVISRHALIDISIDREILDPQLRAQQPPPPTHTHTFIDIRHSLEFQL